MRMGKGLNDRLDINSKILDDLVDVLEGQGRLIHVWI